MGDRLCSHQSAESESDGTTKMNDTDKLKSAAQLLGSKGGKAPKHLTDQDRERRREWARGLAKIRMANKAQRPRHYRSCGTHEGQACTCEQIRNQAEKGQQ